MTIMALRLPALISAIFTLVTSAIAAPVHLVDETPVSIQRINPNVILVDFGRVAFGNICLRPPAKTGHSVTVHFGEAFKDGRINRQPPGTVRYAVVKTPLQGVSPIVVAPPADGRNTQKGNSTTPPAVLTPPELSRTQKIRPVAKL